MRTYLDIDLPGETVHPTDVRGEAIARAGRYLIARKLLDLGVATLDPMSPGNPLIFSAGPLAGTPFSNANRLSVGCKSPLTGGIKEANAGGTFAYALGQLQLSGFTLHGSSRRWVVIHIAKDGVVAFDSADAYLGKGNFEAAALLRETYGKKISYALCGPVGEYEGLLAGIAVSDREGRPSRFAARGGIGAVMGRKKVKAIVVDLDKTPEMHDRKKFLEDLRNYAAKLREQPFVKSLHDVGTAGMADFLNYVGAMPVRNFSAGRLVDPGQETLEVGGDFIREQNLARGGDAAHACMAGCSIQCSNVYVDAAGKELVSPLEYETIGLLGTNCGINDPDDIARLNAAANDLGVDTIELGATLGVLMEAGVAEYGNMEYVELVLDALRRGTERGRLLAGGAARVGAHFSIRRVPVIKKQALSAYDPRVIEVTGISMMTSAQGADHTAGNAPMAECNGKSLRELVEASFEVQVTTAVADSLGLCNFGRSVSDPNPDLIANAINSYHGTQIAPPFFRALGRDTLRMELEFNRAAGFTPADDTLPAFFYEEPLPPTGKAARLFAGEVQRCMDEVWGRNAVDSQR